MSKFTYTCIEKLNITEHISSEIYNIPFIFLPYIKSIKNIEMENIKQVWILLKSKNLNTIV